MSEFLFFHPNLEYKLFTLPEEESKHLIKVLRKTKGEQIRIMDGQGNLASAIIRNDHPKKCELELISIEAQVSARNYRLRLAIAPTKNNDRMEWMLEKCIEIGLDELYFIETKNSERSRLNLERLEKIAIAALKQSKQFQLPILGEIQKLDSFFKLQQTWNCERFIAWVETEKNEGLLKHLQSNLNSPADILVLIGPEGDFTPDEVKLAIQNHFKPVSLGRTILRTETAAVQSASWVSAFYNS
ncbi:MAG: 16S rRNA (uracil(1498)-N(3))-methyltransferase [Bacteroidetes bacterium]|nr:16S rRNA (uracil(1498)-N(3))-methyltransferase [Bacteroidota bacterium]